MMTYTPSSNEKVNDFIDALDHPQKELALQVREAVLSADQSITESIKWRCIVFEAGKNIAQLIPAKQHVTLMLFNSGSFQDPNGLLEGDGPTHRGVKFHHSDFDRSAFQELIREAVQAVQ